MGESHFDPEYADFIIKLIDSTDSEYQLRRFDFNRIPPYDLRRVLNKIEERREEIKMGITSVKKKENKAIDSFLCAYGEYARNFEKIIKEHNDRVKNNKK